jgi:nitroreductase
MELQTALHTRISVPKVKAESLPRELILKLLEAGNQAPNHHRVRPWRFFVLTGAARSRLGDVMSASQRDRRPDLPPEAFDKTRALPLRAPVVIAVGVDPPAPDSKTIEIENVCAASAACQNILLAAHDLGLGAIWRTGEWARDSKVKAFFGLVPEQYLIAFLYVGVPEGEMKFTERPPVDDRVVWME